MSNQVDLSVAQNINEWALYLDKLQNELLSKCVKEGKYNG